MGRNVRYMKIQFNGSLAGLAEVYIFEETDLSPKSNLLSGTVIGTTGSWNNNASATRDAVFDFDVNTFFDAPSGTGGWARFRYECYVFN